jgi:ABC-2 type transport system ATP-binding protein
MSASPTDSIKAVSVRMLGHAYPASRRRRRGEAASPARTALDDVSFDVAEGELFAVLGPNGGGKTTLFRVLATLMSPSTGQVRVFDHDLKAGPDAVRRLIGVVFQHPGLDGKLTVRENLHHHGRMYGMAHTDLARAIPDWLTRFGMLDRIDESAEKLSGGQQRRVELAKAMLPGPRLLLMDEPSTGLDPGARRDLWRILADLREDQGVTIVLTTHLMDEAERCDRLAILASGRLVAAGAPDELKSRIGGHVIHVEPDPSHESNDALQLASLIAERFGPWDNGGAPRVVDGRVRMEKRHGAAIVNSLVTALPGRVRSVSVGQPTLEDVFLHLTGHTFYDGADHA